jgi:N-methylhydantoinase A
LVPLLARKGVDYSDYVLLPFGGAGPMHGLLVARDIGFRRVLVPLNPGVLCATGALVADVRRDLVRTVHQRYRPGEEARILPVLRSAFEALEREGAAWLDEQDLTYVARHYSRFVEMRYGGQSFEITVPISPGDIENDGHKLTQAFRKEYASIYGNADPAIEMEVRDVRSIAIGETPKPQLRTMAVAKDEVPAEVEFRKIFHDGCIQQARYLQRSTLGLGHQVAGPAIIGQYDTTIFVPSGYSISPDRYGNLIAERNDDAR